MISTTTTKTLTDYEQIGFTAAANLADGHAYQELAEGQSRIVSNLEGIWRSSQSQTIPKSEHSYIERFARLIDSPGLLGVPSSSILPTASNSIDLISAYLRQLDSRVLLTHPTFDNLALLLRRRGVNPSPIAEAEILDPSLLQARLGAADVLFLVNPNNPTGSHFSESQFRGVVQMCVANGVVVVIDASFRLFYPQRWDSYQILQDETASFIVFEDTGKVFPTQDMKASILSCSADHRDALLELYNEVYLCVSKFALAVLGEFFDDAHSRGLEHTVHRPVARRREKIRNALGAGVVEPIARSSQISVEWLSIENFGKSDEEVVRELHRRGVGVLPGRAFFWDEAGAPHTVRNVRVSLMKPESEFAHGVELLADYFQAGEMA